MRMKILVALLAAAAGTSAVAQEKAPTVSRPKAPDNTGLYVFGSLGVSQGNDSSASLARAESVVGAPLTAQTVEAKRYNGMALVGYRFNQYFGIEGGYGDLGRITLRASGAGGNFTSVTKIRGPLAALVGYLPVSDTASVYGKFGFVWARNKYETGEPFEASTSTTRSYWGLGLQVHLTPNLFGRLEYTRFNNLGSTYSGQGAYNHYAAGVGYLFQ
ncbi:MAG: outer membrane beta-barrel protein [Betaproteobacteria bacterium]|nr:outer membrane beta-barrel protein [Betaproteobacteria bacterium]